MNLKFLFATPLSGYLLLSPFAHAQEQEHDSGSAESMRNSRPGSITVGEHRPGIPGGGLPFPLPPGGGFPLPFPGGGQSGGGYPEAGGGVPPNPNPGGSNPLPPYNKWDWVDGAAGAYLPNNAVYYGPTQSPRYVCAVFYNNEWSVGKYVNGDCNFSYGGSEWLAKQYKVLIGTYVQWADWNSSYAPPTNGVYIYSNGYNTSYVCGVYFNNDYNTGKIFNNRCEIGWGGVAYSFDRYNVAFAD